MAAIIMVLLETCGCRKSEEEGEGEGATDHLLVDDDKELAQQAVEAAVVGALSRRRRTLRSSEKSLAPYIDATHRLSQTVRLEVVNIINRCNNSELTKLTS